MNSLFLEKPLLRGHFHQAAFFIALGASAMLTSQAKDSRTLFSILIYSICLCGLLGISALYHRPQWGVKMRLWMKRMDHAAIFLLIAGTGTPISMLGLPPDQGSRLLVIFWAAALVGVFQSLFWVRAPKWVSAILYVVMGWLAVPYLSALKEVLGTSGVTLLLVGGIVYTLGAVIYATKKPNPWPAVFGYHEIFHILVVIAAALHFIAIENMMR
jgi:hemolysin III